MGPPASTVILPDMAAMHVDLEHRGVGGVEPIVKLRDIRGRPMGGPTWSDFPCSSRCRSSCLALLPGVPRVWDQPQPIDAGSISPPDPRYRWWDRPRLVGDVISPDRTLSTMSSYWANSSALRIARMLSYSGASISGSFVASNSMNALFDLTRGTGLDDLVGGEGEAVNRRRHHVVRVERLAFVIGGHRPHLAIRLGGLDYPEHGRVGGRQDHVGPTAISA